MRTTHWMFPLFLAGFLFSASAMAADTATVAKKAPATETGKLEKISNKPAATANDEKDCPMNQAKKECDHQKGEPCPYHQDENQQGKMQEKCDHKRSS